jgi:periplasmic divalent cation tolerance protein
MTNILLALTTCPSAESADLIATTLVTEGLAACVNQLSGVQSTYYVAGKTAE